jgi:hypothetical protein
LSAPKTWQPYRPSSKLMRRVFEVRPRFSARPFITEWRDPAPTGLAQETVKKYLTAAVGQGLNATGPPPTERELVKLRRLGVVAAQPILRVAPRVATLEAYRDHITTWINDDHLLLPRIQEWHSYHVAV